MKALLLAIVSALFVVALPAATSAQGVIAGVVVDRTGAPIPGVVVEASSPVLIEKARTAVTDRNGRYRIESLLPGIYSLTLTIGGWRGYEENGLELAGSRTVRVDAELTVGTLSSHVKVTRVLSGIDAHTATQEWPVAGDLIRSIPSARSYNALLPLIPGVVTSNNDIVTGAGTTSFPIHGGRANEGRLLVDGFNIGSPPSGNSATTYSIDTGRALEVTFRTSNVSGESETAGLVMNVVPRSGGNQWQGSLFVGCERRAAAVGQRNRGTGSRRRHGLSLSPSL